MRLRSNGKSDEEIRDENRRDQRHQMNLSAASQQQTDRAHIDKLTEHELDEAQVDMLRNLAEENFLLANSSDAEVHEFRWLARLMKMEIEDQHPAQDTIWSGAKRAASFDDPSDTLTPLTESQRSVIEQYIMGVIARATRGRTGWQQEMFNKQITASETREVDADDDSGGFL